MINQLIAEIKTTKKEIKTFGIIIGLIILTVGSILFWKNNSFYEILFITGSIFLGSGLVIPMVLKPIYFVWMVFASILGWFMTFVILGFLFYVIFTPIGLTLRFFGKKFLELRWDNSKESYWDFRTNEYPQKEKYEKQF